MKHCEVCGSECKRGQRCKFCHKLICVNCLRVGSKGAACVNCSRDPRILEKIGWKI